MSDGATKVSAQKRSPFARPATGIRRKILVLTALVTIVLGLSTAQLARGFAADAVADALYTVLIYALVAILVPRLPSAVVGALAFAVSVGIEFLQLTGIPAALATIFPPSRLVFGTTFVATDLIFYAVGAATIAIIDALVRRRSRRSRQPHPDGTSRRP